jgi:VPDSG-CTERM motif
MNTNIVPPKKVALLSAAVCAVMLAFAQNASATPHALPPDIALAFNDSHVVGTVTPATPANPADVAGYINFMIGLTPGTSGTFHNPPHTQTITRSTNLFGSLPNALVPGAVSGGGTTINLGAGGVFSYLFAKYDGQNDISFVWNVADLTGTITIPAIGPLGHGLSGWILFPPGGQVPDGGATVTLLGAALGVLGVVRRYLFA